MLQILAQASLLLVVIAGMVLAIQLASEGKTSEMAVALIAILALSRTF